MYNLESENNCTLYIVNCTLNEGVAAAMTAKEKAWLKKVKTNLILQHDEDDTLLLGNIAAAVSYAETYQHRPGGHYKKAAMAPTTEQAVVMLASHFYEARDGSTGGFFGDNTNAAANVWQTVNRLLILEREVKL